MIHLDSMFLFLLGTIAVIKRDMDWNGPPKRFDESFATANIQFRQPKEQNTHGF